MSAIEIRLTVDAGEFGARLLAALEAIAQGLEEGTFTAERAAPFPEEKEAETFLQLSADEALPPVSATPPPPASAVRKHGIYTDQRLRLIATMRGLKAGWEEIETAFHELPGPRCSGPAAISKTYYRLKREGKLPRVAVNLPIPPPRLLPNASPPPQRHRCRGR